MNNREAYNTWSESYDTVENKTRDLEARAIREMRVGRRFKHFGDRLRDGKKYRVFTDQSKTSGRRGFFRRDAGEGKTKNRF